MSYRPRLHKKPVEKQKHLRDEWYETYSYDPIDLRHLPKPIVLKVRAILKKLAQGTEYYKLQGKRLIGIDRDLISLRVSRGYRMLLQDCGNNTFQPVRVLTHEAYNSIGKRGW